MKKYIFILTLSLLSLPALAQKPERKNHKPEHREVTELVSDLSQVQKHRIESISKESKERVTSLRQQKQAVHDSIMFLMDADGNQSRLLFPLFDREAELQAAISREMYTTRVRIDDVLTKEQRTQLKIALRKENDHPKEKRH